MTPKSATTPRVDEIAARLHDYPRLLVFFHKYALGPMSKPSCLVCGRDDYGGVGIQHLELPGIVVCVKCRDATARVAELERDARRYLRAFTETHHFDCICVYCKTERIDAAIDAAQEQL